MRHSTELRFGVVRATLGGAHRALIIGTALSMIALSYVSPAAPQSPPELKTFDIASDPTGFSNYKQVVSQFAHKHRPRHANDFCILGYISADDTKSAWVWWRQGGEIILWTGQGSNLDASSRTINLKSDVVSTENDLHGSTYLVTKAWVENITATCERSGVKVHVGPVVRAQPRASQNGAEK